MKNSSYGLLITGFLIAVAVTLSSCGKTDPTAATTVVTQPSTSCGGGNVYSPSYGCIPQGSCGSGYGMYNNQCVPLTGAVTNPGYPNSGYPTYGNCSAGQVYTQMGCLTQGNCPSGFGSYNGMCIYGMVGFTWGYTYNYGYGTNPTCGSGYVFSWPYGCLPQAGCGSGSAWYQYQCVPVSGYSNNYSCSSSCGSGLVRTQYGCLPQSGCPSCMGYLSGFAGGYCMPSL
jgi:hypothetical protein